MIGARSNTPQVGVNQLSGHARVYNWNGTQWVQMGQDLDGPIIFGTCEFGYAVSINDAGSRIIVGGRSFSKTFAEQGVAIVYEYNGTNWSVLGDTIFGSALGNQLGSAVQMSGNGNSIAVGSPKANNFNGLTQVFDWNGNNWVQRGADLVGTNNSRSGSALGFSKDGKIIALGEPWANSALGASRIFNWNGNSWQQLGNTLSPTGSNIEAFGSAVRLNAIGSRVIIGAPNNSSAGNNAGKVQVYENPIVLSATEFNEPLRVAAFPNPTQDFLQINAPFNVVSYNLLSVNGKVIKASTSNSGGQFAIDLRGVNNGLYFLEIQSHTQKITIKVVKN